MPRSSEATSWAQPPCHRIGGVLLAAPDRTLTAVEIEARGGGSNVARQAAKMAEAGLLVERPLPPDAARRPGRRAAKAYHLPDEQLDALRAAQEQAEPPGRLATMQQLVFVDSDPVGELMVALDVSEARAKASWFTVCDGTPQQFVLAFTGEDAVSVATDLVAELQAAGLSARRASVVQVGGADALAAQARSAAIAFRKSRMRPTG